MMFGSVCTRSLNLTRSQLAARSTPYFTSPASTNTAIVQSIGIGRYSVSIRRNFNLPISPTFSQSQTTFSHLEDSTAATTVKGSPLADTAIDFAAQKDLTIARTANDMEAQIEEAKRVYQNQAKLLGQLGVKESSLDKLQRAGLREAARDARRYGILRAAVPDLGRYQKYDKQYDNCVDCWNFRLSEEFFDFAKASGVDMSEAASPGEDLNGRRVYYCEVGDFDAEISEIYHDYPAVFRDIYLYHSDFGRSLAKLSTDVERMVERSLLTVTEWKKREARRYDLNPVGRKELQRLFDPNFANNVTSQAELFLGKDSATDWLNDVKPAEEVTAESFPWNDTNKGSFLRYMPTFSPDQWYKSQYVIPWNLFLYIRSLPATPFDPVLQTDELDQERAERAYQTIGLLGAAATILPRYQRSIDFLPSFVAYERWVEGIENRQRIQMIYSDIETPREAYP